MGNLIQTEDDHGDTPEPSVAPRCGDCIAYVSQTVEQGECRMNPPTVIMVPVQMNAAQSIQRGERAMTLAPATTFPAVKADSWCAAFDSGDAPPVIEHKPS